MNMALIHCSYALGCPFYRNWVDHTRNLKTNVIIPKEGKNSQYDCLTLVSLDDPETGIPMNEELREELLSKNVGEINCPLNLLNNPRFLETKINELVHLNSS